MARRKAYVPPALMRDDSKWSEYPFIARWSASGLLRWNVFWFALLLFLLLGWYKEWLWVDHLPSRIGGVLPLVVPWAGALGGMAISMVGVLSHYSEWGPNVDKDKVAHNHPGFAQRLSWNAWHIGRPFVGAVFGSIAALLLVFVLRTLGVTDAGDQDTTLGATVTLLAVAFIVGYRDRTFRDLADRVIDTIFGPGTTSDQAVSYDVDDSELDFGNDVKVNKHKDLTVAVTNNGSQVLRWDSAEVDGAAFSLKSSSRTLGAYATNEVKVRFAPTVAGEATGTLVIKLSGVEKTVKLKGTAVA